MIGVAFGAVQALGIAGKFASGLMAASARRAEYDSALRDLKLKRDMTIGTANARAAASGIEMGSRSTTQYLASLTNQFSTRIAELKRARNVSTVANYIG